MLLLLVLLLFAMFQLLMYGHFAKAGFVATVFSTFCSILPFVSPLSQASNLDEANLPTTKFIQKYVPTARLLEQIGSELIYVLPTSTASRSQSAGGKNNKRFELLFSELERYMEKMNIKSYGLSDTTLEEVNFKFLN